MNFVNARLMKPISDDGLIEMNPDVAIGKRYKIDLDTRSVVPMFNAEKLVHHKKEIVYADNGRWLAMELLEVIE